MFMKRLLGVAVTGAVLSLGIAGSAGAAPYLQILDGGAPALPPPGNVCPAHPADANHCEVIGVPDGSIYPWPGGPGSGAGIPWQARGAITGGWPTGSGFSADNSSPPNWGTSGWHASYLNLTEASNVTFQFMGAGDSGYANSFWLFSDNPNTAAIDVGWWQMFQDGQSSNPTHPCPVTPNGAKFPNCDKPFNGFQFPDANQYTIFLGAGLIPFAFDIDNGGVLGGGTGGPINQRGGAWTWNGKTSNQPNNPNCVGNPESVTEAGGCPGFFLGADPYLVPGPFQSDNLRAVYAGLTDRGCDIANCDHDFQDMGVRISVPEPGSLALLGLALGGLAFGRRRKGANA